MIENDAETAMFSLSLYSITLSLPVMRDRMVNGILTIGKRSCLAYSLQGSRRPPPLDGSYCWIIAIRMGITTFIQSVQNLRLTQCVTPIDEFTSTLYSGWGSTHFGNT